MMEVDDGPPALSPRGGASVDKVIDEDDSLGYTITMNEESSSSASHSRTATPTVEQESSDDKGKRLPKLKPLPILENGDASSSGEKADSESGKGTSESRSSKNSSSPKKSVKSKLNGQSKNGDEGKDGKKKEEANITEKEEPVYTRTLRTRRCLDENGRPRRVVYKEVSEDESDSSEASESEVEGKNKTNEKNRDADKKKEVDEKKEADEKEEEVDEVIMDSDEESREASKDSAKKASEKNSPLPSAQLGMNKSAKVKSTSHSAKLALADKLASTGSVATKPSRVVVDARTGVSVPYVPASGATSLLSSAPGVRLVLPPGASPSQVMYIPSSGTFLTSTGSGFSASSNMMSMTAGSSASILFPAINAPTTVVTNSKQSYIVGNTGGMTAGIIRPPFTAAPPMTPVPTFENSSKGMIEMVKWEAENHINIKPKYVKPNPKAELGNLAQWLFDLGADIVKEYVYHDLVKLQKQKKDSLSDKEKTDFTKLQEIDGDLQKKVGNLKFKLSKSCKCGFKADLESILYLHREYAHHDRGGFLNCSMCRFSSRQPSTFKFHMEAEHGMMGRMENRPCFFECTLCPYESNYPNRLDQHKIRCGKQFRPNFNMHPSCLTGPEVNLCLENVFYFVFTRQFLNSINPPTSGSSSTMAMSSANLKDTKPRTASHIQPSLRPGSGMVGKFGTTVTTTVTSLAQNSPRMGLPANAGISRTFPVISSQIGGKAGANTPKTPSYAAALKQAGPTGTVPLQPNAESGTNNAFEVCEICGGYVKDRKALRIHFFYAHRIDMPFGVFERTQPPLYCATCFARFWTAQGLQKHIEVHKADLTGATTGGNGVAGKCISCGHRVPNILMHMRMVHNRELRHYLAALMCIFCGNRFSSKREVENHMGNQHGVVVKNSTAHVSPLTPGLSTQPMASPKTPTRKPGPACKTGAPKLNRGSQCVLCNLTFSRNVDLTRHCMRVHHTCMKCGLVVVDKESLLRHTCLHSAAGMRTCQICGENGFHPAYYIKHMRDKHLRRCSVVLGRLDREAVETLDRPITISDSEDEEAVTPDNGPSSSKRQKRENAEDSPCLPKPQPPSEEEVKVDGEKRQGSGRTKVLKGRRRPGPACKTGAPKYTGPLRSDSSDEKENENDDTENKTESNGEERGNERGHKKAGKHIKREERSNEKEEKHGKKEEKDKEEKNCEKEEISNENEEKNSKKEERDSEKEEKHGKNVEKNNEKEEKHCKKEEKNNEKEEKHCKKEEKNNEKEEKHCKKEEKNNEQEAKSKKKEEKNIDQDKVESGAKSRTVSSEKSRKSDDSKDSGKKKTKRKSDEGSNISGDEDDAPYSKKLRRSSRTANDALELD